MPKLYEAWPGTNKFCCCRLITGPHIYSGIFFYVFVIAVIVLYSIFILNKVWAVTPVLPILFFILITITIILMNLTSCSDPGIIPRKPFL